MSTNMDISDFDFADSSYHQGSQGRKGRFARHRARGSRLGHPPMSARQNKKQRKGRNSANNRERTVTTLTEDPNTPYLVPTPSEEPPGSLLSAHLGSKAPMSSQPYQMSNFGGFQTYAGTFTPQQQPYFPPSQSQAMQQQSSQQYQHIPPLSPGKNDLEILQHLKQLILDNQHPVFRAVPQPAALAKLYKGPLPAQGGTEPGETSGPGLASVTPDSGRLAARISSKDNSSVPLGPGSGNQQNSPRNSYHNASGNNAISDSKALVHRIGKSVSSGGGSYSAGPDVRSAVLPTSEEDRDGRYDYSTRHRAQKSDSGPMGDRAGYPSNGIKKQTLDDPMDETHGSRDNLSRSDSWTLKQPPVYSESGRPGLDRNPNSRGGAAPLSAVASGQADARSNTAFDPPDNVRNRDGGANTDTHGWSWQDRNHRRPDYNRPLRGRQQSYHRPRRMSSASDHHRPLVDDPPVRREGFIAEPSQSHAPVDSRGPSTDVVRPSASSDRVPDVSVVDSKRSVDYHPQADARVPPLLSRVEGNAPNAALSTRPSDTVSARALGTASLDLASPDQGSRHPSPRQSTHDTVGGGGGGDLPGPPPRSSARPFPHHGIHHKKKFQKNFPHGAGSNNQGGAYGSPASDHPPPRSGQGRPPSPSVPMSSTSRPVHPRSASNDGRRGRFPSPLGGARVWDRGGPPSGRDISRDRPPASYRGDYEPDVTPMRYGDTRSYGRDYSPPPSTPFPPGERGPPGTYPSPSSGVAPGRDWGGYPPSYLPGNRRDWTAAEEEAYMKSRTWEGRPQPPPPSERDRYDYPPRSSNWAERDYPGRDSYPPGPPPPVDDRYNDRGRPHSVYPPYNRVTRPRSPSPLRRGGADSLDDRPPVKRPREEYDPVEYYPPPPTGGRRGPGEYPHPPPPRAASPGPPPGSGASWPPPTPSSGSSGAPPGGAGLPSDRDYRYPPPVSGGYDRPRSPGPPRGRPPFSRGGGYNRDGGRNTYPPRP